MSTRSELRRLALATVAATALGLTTGCSSPNEPGGTFRTEVTLRPGEVTAVASTPLRIGFDRVAADSRCPATALCIQSGDALVVFNVSLAGSGAAEIRLRTISGATGQDLVASVGGYELFIAGLQPSPETTTPIPSTDYRVTVSVSRRDSITGPRPHASSIAVPDASIPLPPGYQVARTTAPHARLLAADDAAWRPAPAIAWGQAPFGTRFRALWTESMLYVRFDADDTSPWSTMTERDACIWEEEVVEIFLDPAGRGIDYYELEISPANVLCDLRVRRPYPNLLSEAIFDLDGVESAVRLQGQGPGEAPGWIATAAMPFAGLRELPVADVIRLPPSPGDTWRFNVFRIKRPNGPMRRTDGAILAAWSPTGTPSFHVPAAFQPLTFG